VSWKSCRHALSSCEAEIDAAVSCVKEIVWVTGILQELGEDVKEPALVYEDNQSCIAVGNGNSTNPRTRHIGIKTSFLQERITDGTFKFTYCHTDDMHADVCNESSRTPK
jgi:hypothetical protein